jgi:hypothetical protein
VARPGSLKGSQPRPAGRLRVHVPRRGGHRGAAGGERPAGGSHSRHAAPRRRPPAALVRASSSGPRAGPGRARIQVAHSLCVGRRRGAPGSQAALTPPHSTTLRSDGDIGGSRRHSPIRRAGLPGGHHGARGSLTRRPARRTVMPWLGRAMPEERPVSGSGRAVLPAKQGNLHNHVVIA